MSIDNPFPVTGEVEPTEYGYSADVPCASEWLTEGDTNLLQAAADRIARRHGEGTRMRVRFTADRGGMASGFQLLEEVEEAEA